MVNTYFLRPPYFSVNKVGFSGNIGNIWHKEALAFRNNFAVFGSFLLKIRWFVPVASHLFGLFGRSVSPTVVLCLTRLIQVIDAEFVQNPQSAMVVAVFVDIIDGYKAC